MADIVIAHGAWSSGWAWKKMRARMVARGHTLWTPSYTGLGERAHLANPEIDLNTHVSDVVGVLEYEDLHDVILVGHSYGGMVATGVADRAADRIRRLVYYDAFAPQDGECLAELAGTDAAGIEAWKASGDGWRVTPLGMPPDTSEADAAWAMPKRLPHPIKCFTTPVRLTRGDAAMPRHYIYCLKHDPSDVVRPFYERAKREGWTTHELDASHNAHITAPDALADLLDAIARS
jgi:pimeloyl-ACP methyl ester carboxylesterase